MYFVNVALIVHINVYRMFHHHHTDKLVGCIEGTERTLSEIAT